jgi:hypothetical protein
MPRPLKNLNIAEALAKKPSGTVAVASPLEPGKACSYSNTPTLAFSKDAAGLAAWLSTAHPEYNMASLDFYGHLIDDSGEIVGFSSMIQQQFGLPSTSSASSILESLPYLAEFSVCSGDTNGVVVAPFMLEKDSVSFQSDPYSETATLLDEKITIALVSGEMGQPGAKYKLTGNAIAFDVGNWVYEVELTDTMGTIGVGYGPLSFLPQWLDKAQQDSINGGNVQAYLQAGPDAMSGEGSYYFSIPLLQVTNFNITVDGLPFASGSKGYMWVDYVTQSFSEASYPILKDKATWQFLAIQFPPELNNGFSGALMFSKVEMPVPGSTSTPQETSILPTARFWNNTATEQQNPNTAIQAWHEWDIKDIHFSTSDLWPAQKQGEPKPKYQYPLQFTLTLGDPKDKDNYAIVKGKAVRPNQVVTAVHKYEGVYHVTGSIYVKGVQLEKVEGYAWAEIH